MKIDINKPMEVVYEDGEVVEVEDSRYRYTCCDNAGRDVDAIWVQRVDGQPFRRGGRLNVFGTDGGIILGFEESAEKGLRNKVDVNLVDPKKPMEVVWNDDETSIFEVFHNQKDSLTVREGERIIWVSRKDGENFPLGGPRIVFTNTGQPAKDFEKPAILRNKKETQIVTEEYTEFIPFTDGLNFKPFPLNVRVIDKHGNTETLNLRSSNDMRLIENCVAIAFKKVDPLRVEAKRLLEIASKRATPGWTQEWLIEEVLRIQQEEGPKVDVNLTPRPLWFENLMERKRINGESERKRVYDWYMDTPNSRYEHWKLPLSLSRKLENELLSTRPLRSGGTLVISPLGHGISITNAKKLYWQWKAGQRGANYGMGSHENTGGVKPHYGKRTININGAFIEIGCQKIPAEAFTQLAATLKWPDRDPYEYIR